MKKLVEAMNDDEKKSIFLKGIENLKAIGRDEQLRGISSLKIFLFYSHLCLIGKKQEVDERLFFINGISERKRTDPTHGESKKLHVRRFSENNKDLRNYLSLVSPLSRMTRMETVIKAAVSAPRGGHYLGRWLEFLLLCKFFETCRVKGIASFGHYDEFTYWLTELCNDNGIYYTMYQHGIVMESIQIPNKIRCNEVHLYNKYSEKVFRERIINDTAKCVIDGLPCSVCFEKIERKAKKFYIGIIDQMDDEWTKSVAEKIESIPDCIPLVMCHPLRNTRCMEEGTSTAIETRHKYENIDVLIVDYSTLALDFIANGFANPIICTNKEACETVFSGYQMIYSPQEDIKDLVITLVNIQE